MIRSERVGQVQVVTIARPEKRNALDDEHERLLSDAIAAADSDPGVRAIVLTAEGSVFCSGADLKERLPSYRARVRDGEEPPWTFGGLTDASATRLPVVVAINGAAVAGGLELALACDIRLASPEATFAMTEVAWGITPGAGGTVRLPRLVGESVALEMLLTARVMNADEALRVGLVSQLVATADLTATAIKTAERLARNAPLAVAAVRELVVGGVHMTETEALDRERGEFLRIMRTTDAAEGGTAFAERRDPEYRGE